MPHHISDDMHIYGNFNSTFCLFQINVIKLCKSLLNLNIRAHCQGSIEERTQLNNKKSDIRLESILSPMLVALTL